MDCSHYKKAKFLKRLTGIKGYCAFHKTYIKEYNQLSYHPYVSCKGMKGEEFNNCALTLPITGK